MKKLHSPIKSTQINHGSASSGPILSEEPTALIAPTASADRADTKPLWDDESDDDLAQSLAKCYCLARDRARLIRLRQEGLVQNSQIGDEAN